MKICWQTLHYPSEIYTGVKTPRRFKHETQTLFEVDQDILYGRHEHRWFKPEVDQDILYGRHEHRWFKHKSQTLFEVDQDILYGRHEWWNNEGTPFMFSRKLLQEL